jgi:hypothetical protein
MKLNPKYSQDFENNVIQQAFDLWGATAKTLDAAQAKFPGLRVETVCVEVLIVAPEGVTVEEVMDFIKSQL